MKQMTKNNKGFTLVELIVVIAILGVLAAVLVPQYIQYVEKSRIVTDKSTAAAIDQAINVLCADGTISTAETFTWNVSTGALTSNTGASIDDIQPILGGTAVSGSAAGASTTIAKAKSSLGKTSNIDFVVTFTNNTPIVTPSVDYESWSA